MLAVALVESGWAVEVLAERIDGHADAYIEDGVMVRREWRLGWRALYDIRRAVRSLGANLYHLQHELFVFGRGTAALAVPVVLRVLSRHGAVVTTVHGILPRNEYSSALTSAYARAAPKGLVRAAYSWVIREIVRRSSRTIVHSASLLASLREYRRTDAAVVIPMGVEQPGPAVTRAEALAQFGWEEKKRAVFLGYLLPYKGVDVFERAAPLLAREGIEVVIAGASTGDPTPTHALGRLPADTNVRRMGFVPEELLPALFAATDVLVLPYRAGLSASGPLGMAAAYGVPAAVSDVPPLVEAMRTPEAVFAREDEVALAKVVTQIIRDGARAQRIVASMADATRDLTWHNTAARTRELYTSLVNGVTSSSGGPCKQLDLAVAGDRNDEGEAYVEDPRCRALGHAETPEQSIGDELHVEGHERVAPR
jgi:glycosyltransferase involved in cell wall biosynthesis